MKILMLFVGAAAALAPLSPAAETGEKKAPDFQEVYRLLEDHLAGITEEELNRAAVNGLLDQLQSRVRLRDEGPSEASKSAPAVAQAAVYEGRFGHLRIGSVGEDAAKELRAAWSGLGATNQLQGLVLDLRFAGGADYASAAQLAALFLESKEAVLRLENAVERGATEEPIGAPLVILVNEETSGAAEAVAAVLKASQRALLVGRPTSGRAYAIKRFSLSDGQNLEVASGLIELANGQPISGRPVEPDILAEMSLKEEREYLEDPFAVKPDALAANGQAAGRANRLNEAALVRRLEQGPGSVDAPGDAIPAPERPKVITDPVLARALDFLKGVAVLRSRL